jgi:hypothetical protein
MSRADRAYSNVFTNSEQCRGHRSYQRTHASINDPDLRLQYYAIPVSALAAPPATLNTEIATLAVEVETLFDRHPDAPVYLNQPGPGPILGASARRVRRPRPLPGRSFAQELSRHKPHHPSVGEEKTCTYAIRCVTTDMAELHPRHQWLR